MPRLRKLSPEQEAQACQLYLDGGPTTKIGLRFGVSSATIWWTLQKHGLKARSLSESQLGIKRPHLRKLSPGQEAKVCRLYADGRSRAELGRQFGVDGGSISRILQEHAVEKRPSRKLTETQREEVIREYTSGKSQGRLANEFGVSAACISKLLKLRGVETRPRSDVRRIYSCNDAFFDAIDSEAKSYWLGFIAADGCVLGNSQLSVLLGIKDLEHLYHLRADLWSNNPIHNYFPEGDFAAGPLASFRLSSPRLIAGLMKHGVKPRKTLTHEWPVFLADALIPHYLRGYFDGDGCFSKGSPKGNKKGSHCFDLCGSKPFLVECQRYLIEQCNLGKTKIREVRTIHRLAYAGDLQVARIANLMYENATIYLPRKREKIAHLLVA